MLASGRGQLRAGLSAHGHQTDRALGAPRALRRRHRRSGRVTGLVTEGERG
jgi:hypothetical protein